MDAPDSLIATISPSDAARGEWDAIVIGAGPTGSVAGAGLARSGMRTLIVDRTVHPREKVCGGCLSSAGTRALARLGLSRAVNDAMPLRTLRLHAGGRSASVSIEGYVAIGRRTLDARLAALALEAGARLLWPASARLLPGGDVQITSPSGDFRTAAAAVIVADGLSGTSLRDDPASAWIVRPQSRIGAGAILDSSPLPLREDEVAMLCHREGYLGLVRLPCGRVNAAAAFDPRAARNAGGPARLAARLIERAGGDAQAIDRARWKGTPALTRRRARIEARCMLVAGDAARYVEPFTGEGMTWAIESGESVVPHALSMARREYRTGQWTRASTRLLRRRHLTCAAVAGVLRSPLALEMIVTLGAARPSLASMLGRWIGLSSPQQVGASA
ncbi:MAG: FAD-dependent monooxygenase [Phycisphaerae bacterium]|nr:FAD-dependent monooxygenase [Phycisphaerae bacterium]